MIYKIYFFNTKLKLNISKYLYKQKAIEHLKSNQKQDKYPNES